MIFLSDFTVVLLIDAGGVPQYDICRLRKRPLHWYWPVYRGNQFDSANGSRLTKKPKAKDKYIIIVVFCLFLVLIAPTIPSVSRDAMLYMMLGKNVLAYQLQNHSDIS